MANQDPIPATDSDFDTLQAIIVAAVVLNAAGWDIPLTAITKVTDKQTIWAAAWAIAKDKQNSTSAQKKAKDLARAAYEKVLRTFIQKWIYRNDSMDAADIEECGLKPHDTTHTPVPKPLLPEVTVERGTMGQLIAKCVGQKAAKYYGCVMTEGAPLPDWFMINEQGRLVLDKSNMPPKTNMAEPEPGMVGLQWDFTSQRVKRFSGLKHGVTYYFYFYLVNASGVSPLSEAVSIVCW